MTRFATLGVVLGAMAVGGVARAEEKQETLKATVVDAEAVGDSTVCTNGANRRLVQLTAGDQAAKKPCEVHYKKETEQPGHDQLIWSTVANMDSCAAKAKEFVGKLTGWGWTCGGAKQ